jgi:hypothetical protein
MPQNEPNAPAQQPPGVEVDLDAYIATLTGQRNQALDAVAQQAGMIARLQKKIEELTVLGHGTVRLDQAAKPPGPTLVPPAAE